ncbi:MAG: hypothetical protein KJ597_06735 [Nanoarchaeota archaeon]|nr:hypothetical protein [Nanoarchaeota archaeon]
MKKMLLLFVLVLAVFLVGCKTIVEEAMEQQIEAESGGNADVDFDDGSMHIETDEGEVDIEYSGTNNGEWCQEGAEWKMTANTDEGATNAQWMIEGLINSGEYSGLCHVVYTAEGPEGEEARMDYYFSEDGETGYFEMNIDGQVFKQEWNR